MTRKGQGAFVTVFLLVAFILAVVLFTGFDYVPAGNVGVTDTLGKIGETTLGPGVHWTGVTTSTKEYSTRTQRSDFQASAASKDLQIVDTTVVLNYVMDPAFAPKIYADTKYRFDTIILQPAVQEAIKSATSQFTAEELITKRPEVKKLIDTTISEKVGEKGFIVSEVSITNLDFSDEFNRAIEAKQTAEQEALKAVNEKKKAITQAEARAEQLRLDADAQAYNTRTRAEAEAYSLRVVREELSKSNELVTYKAVEKWSGVLPNFYTTGDSNGMLFNLPVQE